MLKVVLACPCSGYANIFGIWGQFVAEQAFQGPVPSLTSCIFIKFWLLRSLFQCMFVCAHVHECVWSCNVCVRACVHACVCMRVHTYACNSACNFFNWFWTEKALKAFFWLFSRSRTIISATSTQMGSGGILPSEWSFPGGVWNMTFRTLLSTGVFDGLS